MVLSGANQGRTDHCGTGVPVKPRSLLSVASLDQFEKYWLRDDRAQSDSSHA